MRRSLQFVTSVNCFWHSWHAKGLKKPSTCFSTLFERRIHRQSCQLLVAVDAGAVGRSAISRTVDKSLHLCQKMTCRRDFEFWISFWRITEIIGLSSRHYLSRGNAEVILNLMQQGVNPNVFLCSKKETKIAVCSWNPSKWAFQTYFCDYENAIMQNIPKAK